MVLPIVNWSEEVVLPTDTVTVMIVELVITSVAEVISRPVIKVMFGIMEVLNSNPVGAFNKRVWPLPLLKSLLFPSVMTREPRVVHAGEVALAALSAEMLPPVAGVMLTVARADDVPKQSNSNSEITNGARTPLSASPLEIGDEGVCAPDLASKGGGCREAANTSGCALAARNWV